MALDPKANPNVAYSFTITFGGKSGELKSIKRRSEKFACATSYFGTMRKSKHNYVN